MNILFFDLECANCFMGIGKICEFGAVLVDSNFNLIQKYCFCMSPGNGKSNKFDKGFCNENGQLQWTYEPKYYLQCPEFTYFYHQIRKLLEDKNTLVFGYAVNNDCNYLNDAVIRYHLPYLHYDAYDLLPIIKQYSNNVYHGLENTYQVMCQDEKNANLKAHLAVDDAQMTMQITKRLCNILKVNINELINKYPSCKLNVTKYVIEMQKLKRKKLQLRYKHHLLHQAWHHLCDQYKLTSLSNNQHKITLADSIIHCHGAYNKAINKILELKMIPCLHHEQSFYYLVATNEERTKLLNNKQIKSNVILTLNELIVIVDDEINQDKEKSC